MRLLGIATHSAKRTPMQIITEAIVTTEAGITGNCSGKGGKDRSRQITALSLLEWGDACRELGIEIPWHMRRANLLIDFPEYGPQLVGKLLLFGYPSDIGVVLEITGETDPCKRMDEVHPGLQEALKPKWRGGITCRVVRGGVLRRDTWITLV